LACVVKSEQKQSCLGFIVARAVHG